MQSSEVQALQATMERKIQNDERSDREQRDSLYMSAAAPLLQVGRLANEFKSAGSLRPGGEGPEHLAAGGGNTYAEALANKRDSEALSRQPRSTGSWEKEQQRPGSWQSGVGNMTAVGSGRMTTLGQGRPLFKQGE